MTTKAQIYTGTNRTKQSQFWTCSFADSFRMKWEFYTLTAPKSLTLRKGTVERPSVFDKALMQGRIGQSKMPGPFCERACFSVEGDARITTAVIALGLWPSPSAISRRVGSIIIDAVQRVASRALAHVSQKYPKVLAPFLGHLDSSRAIQRVLTVVLVVATTLGRFPCAMLARATQAVRLQSLGVVVLRDAAAAVSATCPQIAATNRGDSPTATTTAPHVVMSASTNVGNHQQASEGLIHQVCEWARRHITPREYHYRRVSWLIH